jgi:hypothetical protein
MLHCIEWRHSGRRIVLPVSILAPQPSTDLGGFNGLALLDTGSTTSGITPKVARNLSLAGRGKRPLSSAQGEGQAERYLFRIALTPPTDGPTFPYVFDDVSGFELTDSFQLDALIGMDILSQCDFEMQRNGLCRLHFGA